MNKKELHKFNNRFNSFALAFEQLKKAQDRNSIDKSITINEVHLIDLIGRNQPVNLVKLSEILEVSRSAITQSVRRLTKKDLVSYAGKTVLQSKHIYHSDIMRYASILTPFFSVT